MGNINCSPQDCMNMRPSQAASQCFRNGQDPDSQLRLYTGTPGELIDEWTQVVQTISNTFADDPEGNLFLIKLSKPLLSHLFEKKTFRNDQQSKKYASSNVSSGGGAQSRSSRRGKILTNIMMQQQSPAAMSKPSRREDETPREQTLLDLISLKELLSLINAHTSYPSQFLPIMVQSEPLDSIDTDGVYHIGGRKLNIKSNQSLPQLKARYELQLMHSTAVLYLADYSAVRRFDFQMPEQLRYSSFSLQKVQVSPGTQIDLKARQLINQIREFFHLYNRVIVGGLQLSENEFQIMFAQADKQEICPRQQNWPRMLEGELIHSLSLLPELMQRDDYKETHVLQCIIQMQCYDYGDGPQSGSHRSITMKRESTSTPNTPSNLTKQVKFLVIFKQNVFLPKRIDSLLQLQRDVPMELSRINELQVLNVVYNLAPKTFLLVTSQRKLRHGNRHFKAQVQKVVEHLQSQERAYKKNRKNQDSLEYQVATNEATNEEEETKDGMILSGQSQIQIHMNQSHTIDQLMFKSHQTTNQSAIKSTDQQLQGMILNEDLEQFAKGNSDQLTDQLLNNQAPIKQSRKPINDKPQSLILLEALLTQQNENCGDSEIVEHSHLTRYGPLQGDYLLDYSKLNSTGGQLSSEQQLQKKPLIQTLDTNQKIGKIEGTGYVHYDTQLLTTNQSILKSSQGGFELKEAISDITEMQIDSKKLKYLGIEGNWKVYYEESSLTSFIYLSARPQFIPNCIYEVQFYKKNLSPTKTMLFGHEVAFESEDGMLDGFAVKCNRPAIFVDDLVYRVWQLGDMSLGEQCLEKHTDLKVFYVLFQIVRQLQDLIVQNRLHHSCLYLRSFHINRINWEIKLTNFTFTRSLDSTENRGSISGLESDQLALIGIIESLTQLEGNSRDLKIALCHLSDLIQTDYEQGLLTVIQIARKKLVDNISALISTFTEEEKLESAFLFLLKSLKLNPNLHNPFSRATLRTCNKLEDLLKAGSQSCAVVCQRIVYDSATTKAQIVAYLTDCQNQITSAIATAKFSQTDEETKIDDAQETSIIVMDFDKLRPLPDQKTAKDSTDDIEKVATIGITLLYYYIEKQLNHTTGSIAQAQETLNSLKELYNYDFDNVYYHLIRIMMSDVRCQHSRETGGESENTESSPPNINANEGTPRLDQARILLLKDNRIDLASQIFDDLYLGKHPLAELWKHKQTVDLTLLNSQAIERLIPMYFRQRLTLASVPNGQCFLSAGVISSQILSAKLSGVGSSVTKMQNYDQIYLQFYNMQRLVLIYLYHEVVLPEENFSCADLSDYSTAPVQQQNTEVQKENIVTGQPQLRGRSIRNSSNSSYSSKRMRPQPFYLQLQKFLRRLFYKSQETQQAVQQISVEFCEALLFLQIDENREAHDSIMKVYCPEVGGGGGGSVDEDSSKKITSDSSKNSTQYLLLSRGVQSKFWRLEQTLQLMKERISSFDKQLLVDQHDKFFRQEYYKAAYVNQAVPRYDSDTDALEPEDLSDEFAQYLAIVLQINGKSLDENELEAFEAQKTNFMRCPCCPASLF